MAPPGASHHDARAHRDRPLRDSPVFPARQLYGPAAGLLALTLYTFDPNLLAHSQLITADLYAVGTITFALYFFWRFLHLGGWKYAVGSALMLGLAQIAKYTAVALFPLFADFKVYRIGP